MRRKWWINIHSTQWREWALVAPGGRINIYNDNGHLIRGTDYGNRFVATAALKRMGYRRLGRSEKKFVSPPEID